MSRLGRLASETRAASLAFLRRRTAVFFTFFFPVIIVVIFGVLVQTQPGGGGLFTEPPSFYAPGYLAVVVLFTPLSRVGSEVARHRDGNRFEKLATTPLTRTEWLLAQTFVNVVIIGIAGLIILGMMVWLTGATIRPLCSYSPLSASASRCSVPSVRCWQPCGLTGRRHRGEQRPRAPAALPLGDVRPTDPPARVAPDLALAADVLLAWRPCGDNRNR